MEILRYILIIVEVICSLMLIGLVLLQKTKSEGLGMAFGSGMGETLFGSRAGNVLSKATVALAIIFMLNTVFLAVIHSGSKSRSLMEKYSGSAAAAPTAQPAAQPRPAQPRPQSAAPAPSSGSAVAPTLPGVTFDDKPAASAPAAAPAPAAASAPVAAPVPAEE